MAERGVWNGAITFGLVTVPCKLYTAVSAKNVRFNQLNEKTGNRIKQKRVDSVTGKEVPFEEIVKGYELSPDRYVQISPEELEGFAPKATKRIELETFVKLDQIDPLLYDATYYIGPADESAGHAYGLLVQAMTKKRCVAIGTVVKNGKEKLVAIRPKNGVLVCSTMVWADEVKPASRLELEGVDGAAPKREMAMAEALIDSLSGDFDHDSYQDTFREAVMNLIERKAAGEDITIPAEDDAPAPDLMSALEASLETVKKPKAKTAKKAKPKAKAAA